MSGRTGFHRGIARVRVAADIQKTADLEPAPDDVHNGLARILGDPAPDAMQRDEVEVGHVLALRKIGKRFAEQEAPEPAASVMVCARAASMGMKSVPQYRPGIAAAWTLRLVP